MRQEHDIAPHSIPSAGVPEAVRRTASEFDRWRLRVIREVDASLRFAEALDAARLVEEVRSARRVVTAGAGRSRMSADAFAMRLMQLGYDARSATEVTAPSVGPGDLVLACSGSGETPTVLHLVEAALCAGGRVAVVTAATGSTMASKGHLVIGLEEYSTDHVPGGSEQFSGTLFEQGALVYFDSVVLTLQSGDRVDHAVMERRHSNLE